MKKTYICHSCNKDFDNIKELIRYRVFQEKLTSIHSWIESQIKQELLIKNQSNKKLTKHDAQVRFAAYKNMLFMIEKRYGKHLLRVKK